MVEEEEEGDFNGGCDAPQWSGACLACAKTLASSSAHRESLTAFLCLRSFRSLWLLKKLGLILGLGLGVVLIVSRRAFLEAVLPSLNPKSLLPTLDVPTLSLLPEQQLRDLFSRDRLWLFPKNQCTCENAQSQGAYNFQRAYKETDLPGVDSRRQAEYKHFQRREGLPQPPPLLAQPNLPFGYPVHGLAVMPLHTIPVPGLRFEGPDAPVYEVTLTATLGTLNTLADVPDSVVRGKGQKRLTISTSNRKLLNFVLQHVTYTSTSYQQNRVDVVSLESRSAVAKFPVSIRYPPIPKLYDPGPERKLRNLVTIATKTFQRPHKLKTLLQSIREFYPDLMVIVADDSEKPVKIDDKYVEHYIMPFGKGWFAGRNLAISQVTTKYVLWVDDDFLFIPKSKIETLVEVLENTELDVVGGSVQGNTFQFKLFLEQSEGGDCIHRRPGSFQRLDGFPSCVVTSGVVNFFLAHTERLQRVGFDPRLQRVAHLEFFIDGLGSLLVGSCPGVVMGHQSRAPATDKELAALEKNYSIYRDNTKAQIQFKLALHYFKNHFQCST
ncbi:Beta-1,4 N-acetylgalactosaminyltransferase 2 [Heterocephalus glaber]|uniref:Beta-1,4 N-acetylgalactosaminyltransferase n=1 Tax=Heterocephalus glaber TaxID=10181 RepID=G5C4N6_HETGA|nr:Beta-1,4 N-acetylgalactosaminyltransferase 2 [Heterocephalus glaber]